MEPLARISMESHQRVRSRLATAQRMASSELSSPQEKVAPEQTAQVRAAQILQRLSRRPYILNTSMAKPSLMLKKVIGSH